MDKGGKNELFILAGNEYKVFEFWGGGGGIEDSFRIPDDTQGGGGGIEDSFRIPDDTQGGGGGIEDSFRIPDDTQGGGFSTTISVSFWKGPKSLWVNILVSFVFTFSSIFLLELFMSKIFSPNFY